MTRKREEELSAEEMRDIAEALEEYKHKKGKTLEEVKKELGLE